MKSSWNRRRPMSSSEFKASSYPFNFHLSAVSCILVVLDTVQLIHFFNFLNERCTDNLFWLQNNIQTQYKPTGVCFVFASHMSSDSRPFERHFLLEKNLRTENSRQIFTYNWRGKESSPSSEKNSWHSPWLFGSSWKRALLNGSIRCVWSKSAN